MTIKIIIEKGDNEIWGRAENLSGLAVSSAKNMKQLEKNLREALQLYFEENPQELPASDFTYSYSVDMKSFFEKIPALKITHIARKAGINSSLVRQYSVGLKYPSLEQAAKIESAVRALAQEFLRLVD